MIGRIRGIVRSLGACFFFNDQLLFFSRIMTSSCLSCFAGGNKSYRLFLDNSCCFLFSFSLFSVRFIFVALLLHRHAIDRINNVMRIKKKRPEMKDCFLFLDIWPDQISIVSWDRVVKIFFLFLFQWTMVRVEENVYKMRTSDGISLD